jgi:large subunit ribosomal protein L17
MFRNMVTSLFKHERIRTTGAKAKELRRWADHIITLAKRGDLHARRQALSIIREKGVVHKLFEEAHERFGNSAGGYTRIVKLGRRTGDAALMSLIELVVPEADVKKKSKTKAGKPAAGKKKAGAETKQEKKKTKSKAKSDKQEEKTDVTPEKAAKTKAAQSKKEETPKAKKELKKKDAETKPKEKAAAKPRRALKKKTEKDEKPS